MARRIAQIGVIAAALLMAGCLAFEEQTTTYRYDDATDTLRIFQDFHGIFGDTLGDGLNREELEQLESVLRAERTYFFDNWVWGFDRRELKQDLDRLQAKAPDELVATDIPDIALLKLLLESLQIENGPAYYDRQHRLSAVQQVTLTHVTELIAAANDSFRAEFREEAGAPNVPAEKRELLLRAASDQREFILRRGNAFFMRVPEVPEGYEKERETIERLRQGGIDGSFANGEITWRVGSPEDAATAITLSVSDKGYLPNAVGSVSEHVEILETFDAQAAARKFLKTGESFTKPTLER